MCTIGRRHLTYKGIQIILIINNLILFIFCLSFWSSYVINYRTEHFTFRLNSNNWANISYEICFKVNVLTFLFLFLVNIIGLATNIYILNYFKYEERSEEFILLINWFIISMIFLVIGNNFFTLILGWEMIGLTSFLLINFWKFKITTLSCSFKAFSFNKISDLFLMISFCSLWNYYKVNNVDTLLILIGSNPVNSQKILVFSSVCLLISCSIKSAQLIGHLWLPDSMEAPVPASSLIHSATLVSAGIYLILKFQTLFIYSNLVELIFFWGSITACFGGVVAASQSDMKKLLAYSTISHCGFIFASIVLNNFLITIVYLYLHGLFKAMTFFCAGSIIKVNNTQDTRLMGSNKNQIFNITALIIASINLGGMPFTFGYLYKQLFIQNLIINNYNSLSYGFCIIGLLCSVIYVYKLIYYSCFDFRKGYLDTIILYLQNYKHNFIQFYLNFSYIKVIAFSIIYMMSILFFVVIKSFFLNNYIFFNYLDSVQTNDLKYLSGLLFLKAHLLKIFYIFFSSSIVLLTLNNWRQNFYYIENFNTKITIFMFFIAFNILSTRCLFFYAKILHSILV